MISENHRKKMPMPKKRRGAPNLHSKTPVKMGESLTPKGLHFLSSLAQQAGLSPSELCEAMATGRLAIYSDSAEIKLAIKAAANEAAQGSDVHGVTTEVQPNNQVAQQKDQSLSSQKDESWQKQSEQQAQIITDLQQQITQLQGQLESRVAEQATVQSSYDSLQQQSQQQTQALAEKEQQMAQLQGRLESQVVLQTSQQSSYESLKQQAQEQATELATLRQQIAQLRSLAAVGEARLNKWQNRNASR